MAEFGGGSWTTSSLEFSPGQTDQPLITADVFMHMTHFSVEKKKLMEKSAKRAATLFGVCGVVPSSRDCTTAVRRFPSRNPSQNRIYFTFSLFFFCPGPILQITSNGLSVPIANSTLPWRKCIELVPLSRYPRSAPRLMETASEPELPSQWWVRIPHMQTQTCT